MKNEKIKFIIPTMSYEIFDIISNNLNYDIKIKINNCYYDVSEIEIDDLRCSLIVIAQ